MIKLIRTLVSRIKKLFIKETTYTSKSLPDHICICQNESPYLVMYKVNEKGELERMINKVQSNEEKIVTMINELSGSTEENKLTAQSDLKEVIDRLSEVWISK